MKKKSVWKQVTALAMALCLSGSMSAYASPYLWLDFSKTVTTTDESMTFTYGTAFTFECTVNQVSDVNTTIKLSNEKTVDVAEIVGIDYGYMEGNKFVSTYIRDDNKLDEEYAVFDIAQVQKDQQAGITDRVYGVVFNVADNSWNGANIPFLFRLSSAQTPVEGWQKDTTGWWYRNADGSYPVNTWKEINGKQYYFGGDGYMFHDTITPDGYTVGSDGAWIETPEPEPVNTGEAEAAMSKEEADAIWEAAAQELGWGEKVDPSTQVEIVTGGLSLPEDAGQGYDWR